jgi:hypothetical protein
LCSSWTGAGNQSIGGAFLLATVTYGTGLNNDTLSLSRTGAPMGCNNINFGSINLGSTSYVNGGNVTFGSSLGQTKLTWTAGNTLTLTLGSQNSGLSSPGMVTSGPITSTSTTTFTSPITDQVGDPIDPSPYPIPSGPMF